MMEGLRDALATVFNSPGTTFALSRAGKLLKIGRATLPASTTEAVQNIPDSSLKDVHFTATWKSWGRSGV